MPKINEVTGNIDRSTSVANDIMEDLSRTPVGRQAGDPIPGVALNARPAEAVYFARNLSHQVERREVTEAVSALGHVDEKVQLSAHLDGATIKEQVNKGIADYDTKPYHLSPVHQVLRFDSREFVIPASLVPGEPGEWTPVPEGLAELNIGSHSRLNALDRTTGGPDNQTRKDEQNRLAQTFRGRNICFAEGTKRSEWSFIEIRRQELVSQPIAVDVAKLYPGMKVER
jgi:hypothetical protein